MRWTPFLILTLLAGCADAGGILGVGDNEPADEAPWTRPDDPQEPDPDDPTDDGFASSSGPSFEALLFDDAGVSSAVTAFSRCGRATEAQEPVVPGLLQIVDRDDLWATGEPGFGPLVGLGPDEPLMLPPLDHGLFVDDGPLEDPTALAWDDERDRFLVADGGGPGRLWSLDPVDMGWDVVAPLPVQGVRSMVVVEDRVLVIADPQQDDGAWQLVEVDVRGELVSRRELWGVSPGTADAATIRSTPPLQLIDDPAGLLLIAWMPELAAGARVYGLDADSAEVWRPDCS